MIFIRKPVRIETAFDDREQIRAMFERYAPYRAVAAYGLDPAGDETKHPEAERSVLPWFRGELGRGREVPCRRRRGDTAQQEVS